MDGLAPPPPLPPCAGNGAHHRAPPSREGAKRPPGRQSRWARPGAGSPRGCLQWRNKAASSAGAGGALGVRLAQGQDTQLCTHMACTRASRLCPCTVHLQLLSRHNPHLTGPQTRAFVPCRSEHLPPSLGTHPPTEIGAQSHADLYTCSSCTCLQKPLTSGHMCAPNMPAHAWIRSTHINRNVCVWTQALTHSSAHNSGPSHTKNTNSCLDKY